MKIIKGLINVLTTLIIVVGLVFIGLYISGITPYVVLSGSMEPTIKTGSLCFINTHHKYEKVKEKDIIAFKMDDKTIVTHRVTKINANGLETKGDANNSKDGSLVTEKNYVGKNLFWLPGLGYAVRLIQTTTGKIVFGTIVVILLVVGFLFGEPDAKKPKKKKVDKSAKEETTEERDSEE